MAKGKRSEIPPLSAEEIKAKADAAEANSAKSKRPDGLTKMTPAAFLPPEPGDDPPHDPVTGEILDRIPGPEIPVDGETLDLHAESLTGDIRDVIIGLLRAMTVGWSILPEKDQRERIDLARRTAESLVRQCLNLVTHHDFPHVPVTVDKFGSNKGVMHVALSAISEDANVVRVNRHVNRAAVLLLVDAEEFIGERAPARVDPDQADAFAGQ